MGVVLNDILHFNGSANPFGRDLAFEHTLHSMDTEKKIGHAVIIHRAGALRPHSGCIMRAA